jgi:SAM-dependent methyltransferase
MPQKPAPNWDHFVTLGDPLRSVLDMNDETGVKNRLIDHIHWLALKRWLPWQGKLLDLGCGTGRMASRISERGLLYFGADTSRNMIAAARRAKQGDVVKFVYYDPPKTPFDNGAFDTLIVIGVFQYLIGRPEGVGFVQEAHRLLRPTGQLIMIEQASLSDQSSGTVDRPSRPVYLRHIRDTDPPPV